MDFLSGRIQKFSIDFPNEEIPIHVLEARVVRIALQRFSREVRGRRIEYFGDNTAVIFALSKGFSMSFLLNKEVDEIFRILRILGSELCLHYVDTSRNPADGLSRGRALSTADCRQLQGIAGNWLGQSGWAAEECIGRTRAN